MNQKGKMLIKSVLIISLITAIAFLSSTGCKQEKAGDDLTVYVWEGYLPEKVVDMFEKETGN